ncbi:MAG: hypothetical protein KKD63_10995 [Proteobacteria bacterium]|nr:hypothetical protein [Pseudomonadota bacterium]
MKKIFFFLVPVLLGLAYPSWADDIDIYGVASISVKPNVLIIFDNSGSMGTNDIPGDPYNPATTYAGTKTKNNVYKSGNLYFTDINSANWQCATAKTSLLTKGWWQGKLKKSGAIVTCGGNSSTHYRLGNFENYDALNIGDNRTRMEVAKEVIAKLINDNFDKVNFGLMKFNAQNTNYTIASGGLGTDDNRYESGYIVAKCGATKADLIGAYNPAAPPIYIDNNQAGLGFIGNMFSDTYTPLAETLTEAGLYFSGKTSWFNGLTGTYTNTCTKSNINCYSYTSDSRIQYRCQKNYIIIMTDGEPTRDNNPQMTSDIYLNGRKIPYANKNGSPNYLEDVSYFLAQNDLRVTGTNPTAADIIAMGEPGDYENQSITTYTIGFKESVPILIDTANNGGGKYYTADNADTLNEALNSIIIAIAESNEGFSAAAVPVSRANKAYAGNFVYYGLFQPLSTGNWIGNLKKYGITNYGVIQDADGLTAVSNGVLLDNARSYWSASPDGPAVGKGGAGAKLLGDIENGFSRKIYTYTGTSNTLTNASNLFTTTNAALTSGAYPGLTTNVISAVRRENGEWPLGDFLHSQPYVVHYDDNNDGTDDHTMIFAGANDGMLHCFDDNDGSEKWGFIPQDLLGNLAALEPDNSHQYFVDGTPMFYDYDHDGLTTTPQKKMLLFGERRGGSSYTALDISSYDSPLFKYSINMNFLGTGAEMLGQSWGTPQLVQMGYKDVGVYKTKDVFLMVGGYDDNQDSLTPAATDAKGRALFAIDAQTGALFNNFNVTVNTFPSMTHSIVAAAAFENPNTRTTTRIYAGDMNGNLFAFRDDIFDYNTSDLSVGPHDGEEDGDWGQKLKLFSDPGKKIFYAPNIVNENFDVFIQEGTNQTVKRVGDYVFYGTGDREHPNKTDTLNSFYAIKNNWEWQNSQVPTIVKAYVDVNDGGKIKARSNNSLIVAAQRDAEGNYLRDEAGTIINVPSENNTLFIIDVYDHLAQTNNVNTTHVLYSTYAKDALKHPNNRGWYFDFKEQNGSQVGEKIVSSPVIYGGVVYFSTYIPDTTAIDLIADPCSNPGARGTGYLYEIWYEDGSAVKNNSNNDETYIDEHGQSKVNEVRVHDERRLKLSTKGIPPEPVLVVHEGKATIITGFDTKDPPMQPNLLRHYWRQIPQ